MTIYREAFPRAVVAVAATALLWVVSYRMNERVFAAEAHSSWASWVFLPASLRLLAVLLLGELGAAGLALGALLTMPAGASAGWGFMIGLALTSGLAPLVAVASCRRVMGIGRDLSGLRPANIIVLSLACAVANAILLSLYLALFGRLNGDIGQMATVFVGDVIGTAIVLFLISGMLAFALPKRP